MQSHHKRQSSVSPKKLRASFAEALAVWQQASDINHNHNHASMGSRSGPGPVQMSRPPPPLATRMPLARPPPMERVRSSLNLLKTFTNTDTDKCGEQPEYDTHLDEPRPPEPSPELAHRLQKLNELFARAASEVAKARSDISSRRSKLFETVDPVLLVLKLLPQELSNVHKCVKQALTWDFLTSESKTSFETDAYTICREICFALPHLAITERNESLDANFGQKLPYVATSEQFEQFRAFVMKVTPDRIKKALDEAFELDCNLKRALEGVEMCLRNLTKTRVRYKRLLYEAMDTALMCDEAQKKSGVAMDILLHPAWN